MARVSLDLWEAPLPSRALAAGEWGAGMLEGDGELLSAAGTGTSCVLPKCQGRANVCAQRGPGLAGEGVMAWPGSQTPNEL